MHERGKIRNREYASQLRDFSGMRYGSITPTDIDAFFEVRNKVFIFVEIKHGDAKLPKGQRLALERLVDAIDKPALLVLGKHIGDGDIKLHFCLATEYRSSKKWRTVDIHLTVKQIIDAFLKRHGIKI